MHIRLALSDGLTEYKLNQAGPLPVVPGSPSSSRVAYAAAHVVVDPFASRQTVDEDATLEFRRDLWSMGLGVAEGRDTAQRGMGLDWETAKEIIRHSSAEAGGASSCRRDLAQLRPSRP